MKLRRIWFYLIAPLRTAWKQCTLVFNDLLSSVSGRDMCQMTTSSISRMTDIVIIFLLHWHTARGDSSSRPQKLVMTLDIPSCYQQNVGAIVFVVLDWLTIYLYVLPVGHQRVSWTSGFSPWVQRQSEREVQPASGQDTGSIWRRFHCCYLSWRRYTLGGAAAHSSCCVTSWRSCWSL